MPDSHTEAPDSVRSFATDLQSLRIESGNPTLVALAAATGVSKSVLSDAFAGRRLPTQNTVTVLLAAFGEEAKPWLARREALDPKAGTAILSTVGVRPDVAADTTAATKTMPVRVAVASMFAVAVVSILATSLTWSLLNSAPATSEAASVNPNAATGDYLDYADGVDPMQTICREDAVVAASEERLGGDVVVQMMYSNACMAVWGRITRYDGEASGNSLTMKIYPAIDHESARNQERTAHDIQSIYTPLMIEPNVEARVCGIATVSQDAEPLEVGPPLCI